VRDQVLKLNARAQILPVNKFRISFFPWFDRVKDVNRRICLQIKTAKILEVKFGPQLGLCVDKYLKSREM
jgi:hypothetical protein